MFVLRPRSYLYIFMQSLMISCLLFVIIGGIFVITSGDDTKISYAKLIIFFVCVLIFLCIFIKEEIAYSKIKIIVNADYVYVPKSKLEKLIGIQSETKIVYKDIQQIEIVGSSTNSKEIRLLSFYDLVIKKFIVFTLKNGEQKRIWLDYYTKSQVKKLLLAINKKIEIDIDEILSKWFSTYHQYKKLIKED